MDKIIKPIESVRGEIDLPGDKSISHRVVFIGGIAKGRTVGENFLRADDCMRSVSAFRDMGIDITIEGKKILIDGKGAKGLRKSEGDLYLGNSGTTMRILPGIIAGGDFEATLTGDESLSRRPMQRIIDPLKRMGVRVRSKNAGFPPLVVKGGIVKSIEYATKVPSAQIKSCILFAGLHASGTTRVTEPCISRDHTERMLKHCGAVISRNNETVSVEGGADILGGKFLIPGDISSAAFFIAAACVLEGSDVVIRNIGLNPTRSGFLRTLIKMDADITVTKNIDAVEPYGDVRVKFSKLKSVTIEEKDIPLLIDEVPILAVLAARAEGRTIIRGISELRVKETDRVLSMTENLRRMGIDIATEKNALIIRGHGKRVKHAALESFGDHRTAMSMAIATLFADGACTIKNVDCVSTSFPEFFQILDYLKR